MAAKPKKRLGAVLFFGVFVVTLYTLLLSNQRLVSDLFTRGGFYAFLPIAAAFVFSYAHGTFTGLFWTLLGIEASHKHKEAK